MVEAGRSAGMRAAGEPTGRPEPLRPQAAPHGDRAGCIFRFRARLGAALARLAERVIAWHERVRSRRILASYDDRMLRDIGIDRAAVENESTASFWRYR